MEYIYETHLHTSPVSACGVSKPWDYAATYKKAGYAGFCITNHFFNGNSGVDRSLPWKEQVDFYYEAYEQALESAAAADVDVFFGIEYNFHGDEYLLYGVTKQWLYDHPDMMKYTHQELFDEMNKIGALMIQAHPYRKRDYIKEINLHPECVHGLEVYNTCNKPEENDKALALAKEHGLLMTGGSDIHNVQNAVSYIEDKSFLLSGVILPERAGTVENFIRMIKEGRAKVRFGSQVI